MTDYINAEKLNEYRLTSHHRRNKENICRGVSNWSGCDYCDVYGGFGLPCWKQDAHHNCIKVEEVPRL